MHFSTMLLYVFITFADEITIATGIIVGAILDQFSPHVNRIGVAGANAATLFPQLKGDVHRILHGLGIQIDVEGDQHISRPDNRGAGSGIEFGRPVIRHPVRVL